MVKKWLDIAFYYLIFPTFPKLLFTHGEGLIDCLGGVWDLAEPHLPHQSGCNIMTQYWADIYNKRRFWSPKCTHRHPGSASFWTYKGKLAIFQQKQILASFTLPLIWCDNPKVRLWTPRRSIRSAQQTASPMLTAIMSGGVGISGRELYKYR